VLQLLRGGDLMLSNYEQFLYGPLGNFPLVLIGVLLIWSLVWKGYGLWKAANDGQKYWFIAFLVLNTMGILPILYIVFFRKKKKSK